MNFNHQRSWLNGAGKSKDPSARLHSLVEPRVRVAHGTNRHFDDAVERGVHLEDQEDRRAECAQRICHDHRSVAWRQQAERAEYDRKSAHEHDQQGQR